MESDNSSRFQPYRRSIHHAIRPWSILDAVAARLRKTHTELYREMLEQVVIAEDIGFESAWLVEHHFMEDGMCPSLLVTASAMAARTSTLTIGTSMYLLPLHRPVQTAEDVAVLDAIAEGRLIFGVATGYRPEEYAGYEEQRSGREKRMEEELEILIKSWTTESFSFSGQYYTVKNLSVTPKPHQHPHPPIWIEPQLPAVCAERPSGARAGGIPAPS